MSADATENIYGELSLEQWEACFDKALQSERSAGSKPELEKLRREMRRHFDAKAESSLAADEHKTTGKRPANAKGVGKGVNKAAHAATNLGDSALEVRKAAKAGRSGGTAKAGVVGAAVKGGLAVVTTAHQAGELDLTECQLACTAVAADVVVFVLGLLGLRAAYKKLFQKAVIKQMGKTGLNLIASKIRDFGKAEGATKKAKALFPILKGLWDADVFGEVWNILKNELTWVDWAKFSALMAANITIWVASDGVGFIAKAALSIMDAGELIADSVKAAKVCTCDSD